MPLILDINKKEQEEEENREREYRERLRRISVLKSEIIALEKQKIQYENFRSSLSTLSGNLSELSKNLGYAADNLSKGLEIDGVGAGDGDIKDTSILAGNYASKLSSNNKLIEEKIKIIDAELKVKKSQLLNLSGCAV